MSNLKYSIGDIVGRWELLELHGKAKQWKFLCKCTKCNNTRLVNYHSLVHWPPKICKFCNDYQRPLKSKPKHDLINKRFGRLTVISFKRNSQSNEWVWECQCDCGNRCTPQTHDLLMNKSLSCGCTRRDYGCNNPKWKGCGEISGDCWTSIQRSGRIRDLEFSVTIEEAWDLFIQQNRKCALSGVELKFHTHRRNRGTRTASLDRIDSSKGYISGNVQWVHKDINVMKQDFDEQYFFDLCQRVIDTKNNKTN